MGAFVMSFPSPSKSQVVNGLAEYFQGIVFSQVTAVTVGNTVTETSLLSTTSALGTKTFPGNFFQVGSEFVIKIIGIVGTHATPPVMTLKAYYGATTLSTATITPGSQIAAGTYFEHWVCGTVTAIGASGSIMVSQVMWLSGSAVSGPVIKPTAVAVDTTAQGIMDLKMTWGTADALNTITASVGRIEVAG
jgi:hypothetical protein